MERITVENLLGLRPDFAVFNEKAEPFVFPEIAANIEARIRQLEKPVPPVQPSVISMDAVVSKLKKAYRNPKWHFPFTSRERRILASALFYGTEAMRPIIKEESELELAFKILCKDWESAYLSRLLHSYVVNWGTGHKQFIEPLFVFIADKLSAQRTLSCKPRFLHPYEGHKVVARLLIDERKTIAHVPEMLSLSGTVLSSYYVFNCVLAFIESFGRAPLSFGFLLDFATGYLGAVVGRLSEADGGQKRKARFITAVLVLHCAKTALNEEEKRKIISFAERWVGGPKDTHLWADITGIYPGEQPPDVTQARKILERWTNKIVLKAAFKKFTDPRRGEFWVQYVDAMDSLIVRANSAKLKAIENSKGVGRLLEGYAYREDLNVLLIVMQIGNTVITEVDVSGYAMYAYKANEVPAIQDISMAWVENKRDAYKNLLAQKEGNHVWDYRKDGRLIHKDGVLKWEHVFNAWLQNQVLPFGFLPEK